MFTTGGYCFVKVINQRPMFFFCPGGVAALVTTPLDVAKTWIMLAKVRRWDCCLISLSPDASQMESKVNKQTALM